MADNDRRVSARRALARLTAKTTHLLPGAGAAGVPDLTWEDVAVAVARIREPDGRGGFRAARGRQALILYLWGDQTHRRNDAVVWLCHQWLRRLNRDGPAAWASGAMPQRLLELAVLEHGHPMPCTHCAGLGFVMVPVQQGRHVDQPMGQGRCPECEGKGRFPWKAARLARLWGVHPSTWARTWAPRYQAAQALLAEEEARALHQVAQALRRR
jgi:hypothetical protein